jgi:hypothetical protein
MKTLISLAVAATLISGFAFITNRDSCSNPDFASYGNVNTCKTN